MDSDNDVHVWLNVYRPLTSDDTYGSIVSAWDIATPEYVMFAWADDRWYFDMGEAPPQCHRRDRVATVRQLR